MLNKTLLSILLFVTSTTFSADTNINIFSQLVGLGLRRPDLEQLIIVNNTHVQLTVWGTYSSEERKELIKIPPEKSVSIPNSIDLHSLYFTTQKIIKKSNEKQTCSVRLGISCFIKSYITEVSIIKSSNQNETLHFTQKNHE